MAAGIHSSVTRSLLTAFIVVSLCSVNINARTCTKTGVCSCKLDDGNVIDLKAVGLQNNEPRFKDEKSTGDDYFYSYNPCYPFSETSPCTDVAACQKTTDGLGADYYNLGKQESSEFIMQGNDIILQYTGDEERTSQVKLVCSDSKDELVAHGETGSGTKIYTFDLKSRHCCPPGALSEALSIGSILCIIALVLVIVYLVGGVLFMKFVKKETGSDLIPNKGFWTELPMLVKDGAKYATTPCSKSSKAYDEI
ncbi:cation-dependent mannose-6-phosphate receptor-like [Glandiceps talaboti]